MSADQPDSFLSGRHVGAYEVCELIGAGGMGQVYRAHDTALGRDVALKILPPHFVSQSVRLARFEREARILAALNHPHIAAIYAVENVGSGRGLILELVDGETLADRILAGRLPINEALRIARQIADALDAAHAKGIVHRDLKPSNVKLTSGGMVKVLDFGLAQTLAEDGLLGNEHAAEALAAATDRTGGGMSSLSSTITLGGTRERVIAGTASYMSPEQASGQEVDKRTDVWSFGTVVFELLAGRRVFEKDTVAETIAAVVDEEPDWNALPRGTPRGIRLLLERCLDKNPSRRLRDISHARAELDLALTSAPSRTRRALARAGAILAVVLVVGAAVLWLRPDQARDRAERLQLTDLDVATQPALSPDGRMVAFIRGPGTFTTEGQIYVKLLPDGQPVALTNDRLSKMGPVFSPDGSQIAYTVRDAGDAWDTWIVSTFRGEPRRWRQNASGLTWIDRHRLLYSAVKTGIHMAIVSAEESAAESRDVYVPASEADMAHRSYASPDGKWVLVVEMATGRWVPCRLLEIGDTSGGRRVGPAKGCTSAAWSADGRWMYLTADGGDGFHIWRQRFPDGKPEQLTFGPTSEEGLAIAPDGSYLVTSVGLRQRTVWLRQTAGEQALSLEGVAFGPRVTADARHVVYRVSRDTELERTPSELWVAEPGSDRNERVLAGRLVTGFDIGPDGRIAAAVMEPDARTRIWTAWLDGREPARPIADAYGDMPMFDASGNLFFFAPGPGGASSLERVSLDGATRKALGSYQCTDIAPAVSPDGRWMAIAEHRQAGTTHLAVYPTDGGDPVVIFDGRARMRWSGDGREAFVSIRQTDGDSFALGRTYVLPVASGSMLPAVPARGFRSETELAGAPGVRVLPVADVGPGTTPGIYAFSRLTVARNLYRIPLPRR
jgi:Tol biopolymer transport system component